MSLVEKWLDGSGYHLVQRYASTQMVATSATAEFF